MNIQDVEPYGYIVGASNLKHFEYVRPSSLKKACHLIKHPKGKSYVLAGGTDLLVQIKKRCVFPKMIVSLRDIPGLSFIRSIPDAGLSIGAMTTLSALESSELLQKEFKAIANAAGTIGSVQVRNRATVGGNLCNASPSADMAPILLAYDARVVISDGARNRTVSLENFFTGSGCTALNNGEILKEIIIPPSERPSFAIYLKAYRSKMDIALVGVALFISFKPNTKSCRDIRIALGAVASTPIRARMAEKIAIGSKLENSLIKRICIAVNKEAIPISDVRASATYRRTLVGFLTKKALKSAMG